uniref:Uncharacterized protein n=1 Tax=Glycine max TaxID=3847 RepID=I1MSL7_SOYBN
MVKKATPDWLPFLPGSSFWVPPPPSPLLHTFSIPSHPFFLQQDDESGNAIATPRGTEVTVQLKNCLWIRLKAHALLSSNYV